MDLRSRKLEALRSAGCSSYTHDALLATLYSSVIPFYSCVSILLHCSQFTVLLLFYSCGHILHVCSYFTFTLLFYSCARVLNLSFYLTAVLPFYNCASIYSAAKPYRLEMALPVIDYATQV